jgi:serine/threonine protein kinase/WD40 repeat protein
MRSPTPATTPAEADATVSSTCLDEVLLRAFLSGGLSEHDEAQVAAHLALCRQCDALADRLADDREVRQWKPHPRNDERRSASADPGLSELRQQLCALAQMRRESESRPPACEPVPLAGSSSRGRLSDTVAGFIRAPAPPGDIDAPPQRLGPFRIERQLGVGAFGVVYLAHDERLRRNVALKLPRASVLADPDLKRRFLHEAEVLARLDHPHIVPVFEAGQIEGTYYLAVGLCDGPSLAEWMSQHPSGIDPRQAVRIILPLTAALSHAHHRDILHRDIKPSNVLLDRNPSESGSDFTPRLTDFGLAKIAEKSSRHTLSGMVLGTPQYMAPEQAAGHLDRIGPATDVYGLGAVLYELLTGRPPIQGATGIDTLRRILIDEPPSIRRSHPRMPEDLEAIVFKCLEKSHGRRYASAAELARDLERFLKGQQTRARPLGVVERATRWTGRNPLATALLALAAVVVALAAGIFAYDRQLREYSGSLSSEIAKSSRLEATVESSTKNLQRHTYINDIRAADKAIAEGDHSQATAILRRHLPAEGGPDQRGIAWYFLWALATRESFAENQLTDTQAYQLRLSDDGSVLAAACKDGVLRFLSPDNLKTLKKIDTGQGEVNGVAFNWNGHLAATAGDDGTVKVWRLADSKPTATVQALPKLAYGAMFYSGSSRLLIFGDDPTLRLWELKSNKVQNELHGHTNTVEAMAVSPDGQILATVSSDKHLILWSMKDFKQLDKIVAGASRMSSVAFSPDSKLLATGGLDRRAVVYNVAERRWIAQCQHFDAVHSVIFSLDGKRIFSGDRAGTIRSWRVPLVDKATPTPVEVVLDSEDSAWQAHQGRVWSLLALPGGERVLSAGEDGKIRGWTRGDQARLRRPVTNRGDDFADMAVSADDRTLYAVSGGRSVAAFDVAGNKWLYELPATGEECVSIALLEDRRLVASGTESGQIHAWDLATRSLKETWSIDPSRSLSDMTYSPQAGLLAVTPGDDVLLVNPDSGRVEWTIPAPSNEAASFSPNGKRIAVDTLNRIAIYDIASRRQIALVPAHSSTINALCYSPEGTLLASASNDRSVKFWTADGKPVATLDGHRGEVQGLAFADEGKTLITVDTFGMARIIDVLTRRVVLELPTGFHHVSFLRPFHDNRRFIVRDGNLDLMIIGPAPATPAD